MENIGKRHFKKEKNPIASKEKSIRRLWKGPNSHEDESGPLIIYTTYAGNFFTIFYI